MRMIALLFTLITTLAYAQQDQRLSNGHWSYYGKDFYSAMNSGRVDRTMFNKIYNDAHKYVSGDYDKIDSTCSGAGCYRHISVGYDSARKIMFGVLDILRDNRGTYVLDVYCGKKFYFDNVDEVSRMHDRVNIEHTWPQSKFNGNFKKDMQKSDMHHLYLTDSKANSMRGNSPFGFLASFDNVMGGDGCDSSRYGFVADGAVYTPPANHRGNVARALFYFSMRYNLGISNSEERVLRRWNNEDPIDANEIRRHELIAKYQKVRNPFIDFPELVNKISDF